MLLHVSAHIPLLTASTLRRYLPIGGYKPFIDVTMKLAYGDDADVLANKQVAAVQALSGTGACRLMAEFQNRYMPNSKVLIPKPTWSNHHNIWRDAKVPAEEFRYYKPATRGLDYDGMLEDLRVRPLRLVLAHSCPPLLASDVAFYCASGVELTSAGVRVPDVVRTRQHPATPLRSTCLQGCA